MLFIIEDNMEERVIRIILVSTEKCDVNKQPKPNHKEWKKKWKYC